MWPFTRNKKDKMTKSQNSDSVSKVGARMIRVRSLDFHGSYSESANKKFILGWQDSDHTKGIGGFRESGEGTYILAENGKLRLKGRLQRPNGGNVADNGTFIINDWMFGEGKHGTFYVFDKEGVQLIKHRFKANFYNNGVSPDGKFAVCQCAGSDTADGNVLAFFDIETGALLWKKIPKSGWADSYDFDCEKKYLYLGYRDEGKFRYDFDGKFLDKEKWETEQIENASAFELSNMAKNQFKEIDDDLTVKDAKEILSLLRKAFKKGLDEDPNEKANAYRTAGEVNEAMGQTDNAIKYYEKAIELNPKVGVKRRLGALKKSAR